MACRGIIVAPTQAKLVPPPPPPLHYSELGTRSFFRGSLSAPHSIFSPGSLTLTRSFLEFPFSLVAQTLVAQPVVRWAKKG